LQNHLFDALPQDDNALKKLRSGLDDRLAELFEEIRKHSQELGESYSSWLKNNTTANFTNDSEILVSSRENDDLLDEFNEVQNRISAVEDKLKMIMGGTEEKQNGN
jgi:uncharacterized coiled-coil DUF342 family protein